MKNIISILILLFASQGFTASWNGRIFRVADKGEISHQQYINEIRDEKYIIMGENHVTPEVQDVEVKTIRDVVTATKANFVFAWEFLAYSQQTLVDKLWDSFINGTLSGEEFIKATLNSPLNNTYIPVLKTVAENKGKILGLNLTREEKSPVTKGGIKAADPKIIPANYEIGGSDYLERFKEAMGDHGNNEKVANYFDAQCLTDDVMANELSKISAEKVFVIAGHFHTDYFDGFVRRANVRIPNENKIVIRIIDASEFNESELMDQLLHPKYGQVADYAYFVKEPIAGGQK